VEKKIKILFVAFPFSIHTARWINQLSDCGWELHLYSSHRFSKPTDALSSKINYHSNPLNMGGQVSLTKKIFRKAGNAIGAKIEIYKTEETELINLISEIKPNIIHSLESQHAGYLVSRVKQAMSNLSFPTWIHSNWGVDLHFFGRLKEHVPSLKKLLSNIDVFIAEGKRDEMLARQLGFTKNTFTFPSVGGGFHIPAMPLVAIDKRNIILVKGTQDVIRRGLNAIRALERCIQLLQNYRIILYSSCNETRVAAELFFANTNKEIEILGNVSQQEMLDLNSKARINICVNMSDGVPNAMIEAMLMGAFPIQSDTSLADEWIEDGLTGFLVPPEDTDVISEKITLALTNDEMIIKAAEINYTRVADLLNYDVMKHKAIDMYKSVLLN
jgi:glycosyltransferase involved in cell wall biosynthesis